MAVAGTLEIQLLANIARLQKDMDDAKRSVGGAMSAIEKSVGMAARAFGVLGVSVSLGALVLAAKRINDTVDAMNDLADATGASIENISALDRVARMTGANMDTVGQSLIKFNQALGTTTKAGGDAEKVLTALGLNAKTLRDMDPAEALRQTAVALSQFADDGNKARAVQELFGKSLKEVAPFLKDLAESGELVATVTAQQALEAEKFNKELFKMQAALTDAGRAMANPMVTGMNLLIEHFRLAKKEGDGFLVTLLKQTEIARLLGMNKASNGYSDTRRELDLLNKSLLSGNLSQAERAMAEARQAELIARQSGYLNSTAGAGRGVAGYGELPKGSLELPADIDKKTKAVKGLTEAEKQLAEQRKRDLAVGELRNKLTEENAKQEAKALADLAKMMDEYAEANARGVAESVAAANQAEAELAAYGLLKSSVMELTLAHLEQSKELAALAGEDTLNIERRIDAQKRLIAATRGMEVLDANKKAAEDAAREWQKASDQIGQSLTDALMRGGKSGADYIKDLFRTMVLRPIVQAAVQPVAGAVTNALGMGGGGFGNIAGLTNLAGGGMSIANSLGTSFANMTGGGLDALLATNGAFGTATGAGAGLMSGLASALPYAGIALAVASFLEGDRGGPKTEGGADLASTIQQQYNGIAAQLGITNKAIFEAFYSKDPQGDSLTQLRVATLSGGRNIYERLGEENVGRSDAEFAAAVGDATMRAIIAALKDSDLSNEYKQYLNALADDASTADMQRAIDLIGQRKALDEEWLTLTSTDAENLARARKRELDAMDPTLRAIKERIWAEQDLRRESEATAAMQSRLGDALLDQVRTAESVAREAISRQDAAAQSLRRYLAALTTGPMAALSPEAQYQATRAEFMRLSSLSLDDPERQSKLEEVGTAFLEASRSYNASSMAYFTDLAMVRGAVEASQVAAQTQADIGRMQLTALQSQYGMLSAINGSVIAGNLTVSAAIASLAGALSAAGVNGVRPTTPTGGGAADYYADNPAAAAPDPEGIAFWNAVEQSGAYRDMGYDSAQQWFDAHVAYLNGINGSHASGLDYVPFDGYRAELHQGERVLTASQARGQDAGYAEMVAELRGLRTEVARLTTVSASGMQANLGKQDQIVQNTGAAAKSAQLEATRGVMA